MKEISRREIILPQGASLVALQSFEKKQKELQNDGWEFKSVKDHRTSQTYVFEKESP